MTLYQLPPLKDEKKFEEFICDLLNEIQKIDDFENTEFQNFGIKGQKQKGIDIFSAKNKTVIQCKLKDLRKKDDSIRKSIIEDIHSDLKKAFDLQFEIKRFIFASTFRDDADLQEFVTALAQEAKLPFVLEYWGWDTISKYAQESDQVMKRYFPKYVPKPLKTSKKTAVALPEGALGGDLHKKNYIAYLSKRYGDWKQLQFDHAGKGEKFNWASHNKSLMNRYHAAGINYIPVQHFDDLVKYLSAKIDGTIFGKSQISKNKRNYSTYEEHMQGLIS